MTDNRHSPYFCLLSDPPTLSATVYGPKIQVCSTDLRSDYEVNKYLHIHISNNFLLEKSSL